LEVGSWNLNLQIHQLKPIHRRKKIKRIGRGGKRGTYSGRGQKGQRARAGRRIKTGEQYSLLKLPKLRGVKHKSVDQKPLILNLKNLDKIFENPVINKEILLKKKLIKKSRDYVKILGAGSVKRAYVISGVQISKAARQKIEAAGGKITNNR